VLARLAIVLTALFVFACDEGPPPPRTAADPPSPPASAADALPPTVATYGTEPSPNGATGGPQADATATLVERVLRERGDDPKADGRLAILASWGARQILRRASLDPDRVDAVARRLGFVGPTPWLVGVPVPKGVNRPEVEAEIKRRVASAPKDMPLTRYGVASIGGGFDEIVVVALASLEVKLLSFPKHAAVAELLDFHGEVGERFTSARLSVTFPHGGVKEWRFATREMQSPIQFAQPGVHRVEVFGEGATGPVVVANFPVYVGVDEPLPAGEKPSDEAKHTALAGPDAVAARMLESINAARVEANLDPLAPDDALAAVGRGHAEDMASNQFFSHVSPTTGDPGDRLRRASVRWKVFGENLSRGESAEEMHRGLMGSPGHRANILEPRFTHVGIGVVVNGEGKHAGLIAVCVFAQESRVSGDDWQTKTVLALNDARRQQSIDRLAIDPSLARAALAAADALAESPQDEVSAMAAARASIASSGGAGVCVELVRSMDEGGFEPPHLLLNAAVTRAGVAAVKSGNGKGLVRAFFVYAGSGISCPQ
jgi:uncharacterized protein YkwD